MSVKEIPAARFRAQCLALLDRLGPEGLVITNCGRPVARLLPIQDSHEALIGSLRAHITVHNVIFSTGKKWNAES
jgi:antitoxin (DNA-binding transcriptional repressor) of toxin-antitoxin stability system